MKSVRCEFEPISWQGLLDTTLCDKVCQRLVTERWLSLGTPVYSTNKNDCHDITEILLKVAFDTTSLTLYLTEYLTENMMYDMFHHNIYTICNLIFFLVFYTCSIQWNTCR